MFSCLTKIALPSLALIFQIGLVPCPDRSATPPHRRA